MEILDMFNLKGKKAVITGGAGILGSAIAKGLGKAGAEVAICDIIGTDKVINKFEKEGIKAKGYYIDVMDIKKIKTCYNEIINNFDRIDILINAAGGNIKKATTSKELSFFDLLLSALERVTGLNLAPGFLLTQQNHYLLLDDDENITTRAKSIISHTSMGKFGKPEDLIGACIWLAFDASRFVTGVIVPIDGGFNAYSGV
jgi:NAD(P)-dependent dehydrogenase (short-subunit alcohol dehydrogenase family)